MRQKICILFIFLIGLTSCNKKLENPKEVINGKYIGTFERKGNKSNVELNLTDKTFVGKGESPKFPGICEGTYATSGNTITFINTCNWTAEFDWSLILSGDWAFSLNNNTLILNKVNGDNYTLTRQ